MAHTLGGKVTAAQADSAREYGKTETYFMRLTCKLFKGLPAQGISWMSHSDYMAQVPDGLRSSWRTRTPAPMWPSPMSSVGFYGVQFHPEVNHTEHGTDMIRNFLYEVCGAVGRLDHGRLLQARPSRPSERRWAMAKSCWRLSGGVDSSVAAALLAEAVGSQLTCVFVDHGLMRKNEGDEVEAAFAKWDLNFVRVNAEERFLTKLAGVSDPETKRKIIGEEFIRVFEEEAKKIGTVDYLAAGHHLSGRHRVRRR